MHLIKFCWALRAMFYKLFFQKVGFKSYIGKPLFVAGVRRISIGSRTRIFPGMRIEAIGTGRISIGNNTVIEQNAHIISMDQELIIGDDVTIAPNVFITNVNHAYEDIHKSVMDQGYKILKTGIGNGCFIGFGATIQSGTILGNHCIVGSNSVVKGVFPDNCVIVGSPAKIIKVYDKERKCWKKE